MLTIGSRGSALALWQANWVKDRLEEVGAECRIEIIKTTGDRISDAALSKIGGKGLFTKEIDEALIEGRIDVAVHSLKDLPTAMPEGLSLAAVPEREDARDALIGLKTSELQPGTRVGASSLRRGAQLQAAYPGIQMLNIRGNVDTRLRKLDAGEYDGIVLAAAGLNRLGWSIRITEILPVETMCPAAGQGALGVETRTADSGTRRYVEALEHAHSRLAVTAERAALAALGGGCQVPIGLHAIVAGAELRMVGVVALPDGSKIVTAQLAAPVETPEEAGRRLADQLLAKGAGELLEQTYGAEPHR